MKYEVYERFFIMTATYHRFSDVTWRSPRAAPVTRTLGRIFSHESQSHVEVSIIMSRCSMPVLTRSTAKGQY